MANSGVDAGSSTAPVAVALRVVDQRPVMVRKFGVRLVAVYGVPA